MLAAYKYNLSFREGKNHGNVHGLSRLPLETMAETELKQGDIILFMDQVETMPVTADQICWWTDNDPVLSQVRSFVLKGWPNNHPDQRFRPYFAWKTELSTLDGCLLWETWMVIPPKGHKTLLQDFHDVHPGMTQMKSLA